MGFTEPCGLSQGGCKGLKSETQLLMARLRPASPLQNPTASAPSCQARPGTFPLNITVAQLSFSFFRTKTMFPGRTCSSSAVSGMNSYRTRCGCPLRALGAGAADRSGKQVTLFYFVGGTQTSTSMFL